MQDRPALSVVIPAYAEADNLRKLLPQIVEVAGALTPSWEVLVVDTVEPMDDTPQVCRTYGVTCVPRRGGNDYGDAIRTGITACRGDWVAIMDADGSHDPAFLAALWEARERADVVIASRYVREGSTENPFLLVAMSRLLNAVFALVVHIPVRDVSNSFRIYRGEPLRALTLTSSHFDIQEEILGKLVWGPDGPAGVLELPFRFKQRLHGRSKRSMALFLWAFITAMFRLRSVKSTLGRKAGAGTAP